MDERKSFLKEKRLCFACYETNHASKGCLKRRTCQKCKKRHPTALHVDGFTMNKENSSNQVQTADIQTIEISNVRIDLSRTVCGVSP